MSTKKIGSREAAYYNSFVYVCVHYQNAHTTKESNSYASYCTWGTNALETNDLHKIRKENALTVSHRIEKKPVTGTRDQLNYASASSHLYSIHHHPHHHQHHHHHHQLYQAHCRHHLHYLSHQLMSYHLSLVSPLY